MLFDKRDFDAEADGGFDLATGFGVAEAMEGVGEACIFQAFQGLQRSVRGPNGSKRGYGLARAAAIAEPSG